VGASYDLGMFCVCMRVVVVEQVTEENKHEYVQLVAEQQMTRGIKEQVMPFRMLCVCVCEREREIICYASR
jgi:hypothetical protein